VRRDVYPFSRMDIRRPLDRTRIRFIGFPTSLPGLFAGGHEAQHVAICGVLRPRKTNR